MSVFTDTRQALDEEILNPSIDAEERLTSPAALRSMHARFCRDDAETSSNRAAIQELMDFVPPYDQADLDSRGMGDRFNINYGLAASIKTEASGAYLEMFTAPEVLVRIALDSEVDPDMRTTWSYVMSDEWTKMMRAWDLALPNRLVLADIFVVQGLAITWFEDKSTMLHEVSSLEECKFDADAVAVPSKIEAMTISRTLNTVDLYAKIEGEEDNPDINGWNGPFIKKLIETARPVSLDPDEWNYEAVARLAKSSRIAASHGLPAINLVWGAIRELDGSISVYAVTKDLALGDSALPGEEQWVYRKRSAYDDANQMFQLFAFSVGNKNRIYTIRGLGYPLYEPGQGDNILRCKAMDAARHRASEIYQAENVIDSIEQLQFIDTGHCLIAPKGLKGMPQTNSQRMDENIGWVLDSNQKILDKHSAGLANSSLVENAGARRNEMQVTAELEHVNKMQGFAVSLYQSPNDKLTRELVRRSFYETQTDRTCAKLVERMKEACIERGVPRDVLNKIDLAATQATRLVGAGSKGNRLIGYQQVGALFAEMDPQGKEFYNFDYASELKGSEAAERYFGRPGERRGHIDVALARLENNDMDEGTLVEPVDGENPMVHLNEHIEKLVAGIELVNQGQVDISDWTMRNIPLYRHCVATLERTTVHENRIQELNSFRQQIQQAGEIIDNGLRHINKIRQAEDEAAAQGGAVGPDGQPIPGAEGQPGQPANPGQADNDMKMMKIFAEAKAKIEVLQQMSAAKQAIMQQESIAKIGALDAETAAKIKRSQILARAGGSY